MNLDDIKYPIEVIAVLWAINDGLEFTAWKSTTDYIEENELAYWISYTDAECEGSEPGWILTPAGMDALKKDALFP